MARSAEVHRNERPVELIEELRFVQVIDGCLHVSCRSGKDKTLTIYNRDDWEKVSVYGQPDPGEKE